MNTKLFHQRILIYYYSMIRQNHNVTAVYINCTKVVENCIVSISILHSAHIS